MTDPVGLVGKGFGCRWGLLWSGAFGQPWTGGDRREGTPGSQSKGLEVGAERHASASVCQERRLA